MTTGSTTKKFIGVAVGLLVLGLTVYVASAAWKKGQATKA